MYDLPGISSIYTNQVHGCYIACIFTMYLYYITFLNSSLKPMHGIASNFLGMFLALTLSWLKSGYYPYLYRIMGNFVLLKSYHGYIFSWKQFFHISWLTKFLKSSTSYVLQFGVGGPQCCYIFSYVVLLKDGGELSSHTR